jgi:hypothetical protein
MSAYRNGHIVVYSLLPYDSILEYIPVHIEPDTTLYRYNNRRDKHNYMPLPFCENSWPHLAPIPLAVSHSILWMIDLPF